ncbi:esterase/lipase family protein [Phaeovulum sp.]|uniref:esterase/lipase family protein n=1 Tax=Phaeovulum sp. TaxID=2934796 RepID=UPI0035631F47
MLRPLSLALLFVLSSITAAEARCVVLLHGLARSDLSLILLEGVLKRQGYQVVNSDYPSTEAPLQELVGYVDAAIAECHEPESVDFVTHSMGGILLRVWALKGENTARIGRAVMLAPPNQGSEFADLLMRSDTLAWLRGPSAMQLATEGETALSPRLPGVAFELGVIAGNRKINPIASLLIDGENDGIVSVESTRVEGMNDHIVLPVAHTTMVNDPQVIFEVQSFLAKGQFVPVPSWREAVKRLIDGNW